MTAYPSSFYRPPDQGAVTDLEREQERQRRKGVLKEIREKRGCSACVSRGTGIAGVYTCMEGHTHHSGGWCKFWHCSDEYIPWRSK
jgi:hypothetical protein